MKLHGCSNKDCVSLVGGGGLFLVGTMAMPYGHQRMFILLLVRICSRAWLAA
jgi:hypothetical protein